MKPSVTPRLASSPMSSFARARAASVDASHASTSSARARAPHHRPRTTPQRRERGVHSNAVPSHPRVDEDVFVADASCNRRRALSAASSLAFVAWSANGRARATSNTTLSDAWSALGGGDADLVFPELFEGNWIASSTCTAVDAPLGDEFIRDRGAYERQRADIGAEFNYPIRFSRNSRGDVVQDRAFNVRAVAEASRGGGRRVLDGEIDWDINDPNVLKLTTGDGARVFYRVQARSMETNIDARALTTSELAQIVVDRGGDAGGVEPKVKSTRVVTKYKYRTAEEAKRGPQIVVSQTVYEYLTSFDDDQKFIQARGKPVQVSVYKLALVPYDYDTMK